MGNPLDKNTGRQSGTAGRIVHLRTVRSILPLRGEKNELLLRESNGHLYRWDIATSAWVDLTGAGGVTDHGALTGLGDDDHPQYMTDAEHVAVGDGAPHHAPVTL